MVSISVVFKVSLPTLAPWKMNQWYQIQPSNTQTGEPRAAYSSSGWSVNLDFHNFTLNDLCFLPKICMNQSVTASRNWNCVWVMGSDSLDPHSNGFAESLCQGFCFAHLQRENLTSSNSSEWSVLTECLCHAWDQKSIMNSPIPWYSHTVH